MGEGNKSDDTKLRDTASTTDTTGSDKGTGSGSDGTKRERKPRKAEIQKEFLGVADVEEPVPVPKKRKPRKKKEDKKDTETLQTIIRAVYGMVAARFGEIWNVSDDEAKSIAEPLASILARYEKLIMVSNYSDVALLLIALGTVTVPRVIVTMQTRPKGGNKTERTVPGSDRKITESSTGDLSGNFKSDLPAIIAEPY